LTNGRRIQNGFIRNVTMEPRHAGPRPNQPPPLWVGSVDGPVEVGAAEGVALGADGDEGPRRHGPTPVPMWVIPPGGDGEPRGTSGQDKEAACGEVRAASSVPGDGLLESMRCAWHTIQQGTVTTNAPCRRLVPTQCGGRRDGEEGWQGGGMMRSGETEIYAKIMQYYAILCDIMRKNIRYFLVYRRDLEKNRSKKYNFQRVSII